jgi:putative DNA primase/helicase
METYNETQAPAANRGSGASEKQHGDYTHIEIFEQFSAAMLDSIGYAPEIIIADGDIHRIKDNNGKLNGWYSLHTDGRAAGSFGDWKQGIKIRWKLAGYFKPLNQAEKQKIAIESQRQVLEKQAVETKRHEVALKKADYYWRRSTPVINHQYLVKKGVKPHTARCYRGCLVIPLYDENRVLVSLQFIGDDGSKRMMKGGKAQGSCCFFGDAADLRPDSAILICEGWATGSSLYEATGYFTIVAFSAGNLTAVAIQIRKQHPNNAIIICGDNDFSGTGQAAAKAAALAIGGKYLIPVSVGCDWNDVINMAVNHE